VRTEKLNGEDDTDRQRAAELLAAGKIIAFPTETVYGLGVRADRPKAVEQLYRVKNRPREKKFTLLVPSPDDLTHYADPPEAAHRLAERFWPGPLTLVMRDGQGGEVGLRCPDDEQTRDVLRRAEVPVAAPSANLTGEPPARNAAEVLASFNGRIAAVLDGGHVRIGTPSTVVRVSEDGLEVLRAGSLAEARLREALEER
jgi:L-threonylcarbamoyladenylate synthase